jgi:hypothetical protein
MYDSNGKMLPEYANGAERRIKAGQHFPGTAVLGATHAGFPGLPNTSIFPSFPPLPLSVPSTIVPSEVDVAMATVADSIAKTTLGDAAHTFLNEAARVMEKRAQLRDTPAGERTAAKIAKVFNALTGHNISEADAWQFLVILKLVRARSGNYNRDDYVDLAAYSGLLGECESKNSERNKK